MKRLLSGQPRRLGILGGTFNPVHNGHLIIADAARRALGLDRVVFIPSSVPPHKQRKRILAFDDRYAMLKAAVRGNPDFTVSDIEHRRTGMSYTVDTLRSIRAAASEKTEIFFLIGADNLPILHTWREPDEIVRLCTLVSLSRPGTPNTVRSAALRRKIRFLDIPQVEISATAIRALAAAGEPVRYLVPPAVERYIVKNGIYRR